MPLETITLPGIKRGQTFSYTATCPGAQLEEFTSQVNTASGTKMSDVEIEATGDPNTFRFVVRDTRGWQPGLLRTDIKRTVNGETAYSLTMLIPVEGSETP
ncbi:hypothetical protein SAMN05216312_12210 [Cohnella sp. OV330]|uniref:hypothetical protein n=1 Tax=Cohnella sp. OV330 TaxID=1855288 RepID=UPI0008EAF69A|nr:hypothetical protein [Cohnella sp. OV330]SFB62526.1 hypothetical protein SAMN05216312_12210 [Cohnella sp. OV330]